MIVATPQSSETLRNHLSAFDGKAVSYLSELQAQDPKPDTLQTRLTRLFGDADEMVQRGASWLLFDRMKAGHTLTDTEWHTVSAAAPQLTDWFAALHLLQMISLQTPPVETVTIFAGFVRSYLTHNRPFLRAWSISALAVLAGLDASLRAEAQTAQARGLADAAASVRARAKNTAMPG